MINNKIEDLVNPFRDKVRVFMAVVRLRYKNISPFETLRTKERQKWLFENGKSRTLNSYHLKWKAVDRVFLDKKWNPTWVWDYKYLHYIGFFCGMTPIYNSKWKLLESCHLQDDGRTIKNVMKKNSENRHKTKSKTEQNILNWINEWFRLLWYK